MTSGSRGVRDFPKFCHVKVPANTPRVAPERRNGEDPLWLDQLLAGAAGAPILERIRSSISWLRLCIDCGVSGSSAIDWK